MGGRRSWHRWSRPLSVVALACVALASTPLQAAPPRNEPAEAFRMIESSSAGCGHAGTFVSELQSRTDRLRPARAGEHAVILVVETFETEGGVRGQLTVHRLDGAITVREVPGRDCHEVESAMALIAALIFDPLAGTERAVSAPRPEAQAPAPVVVTPQESSWSIRLDARATLQSAIAPKVSWGGALGAMLTHERGRLRPSIGLAGRFAVASATQPSGSADLQWAIGELSLCPVGARPTERLDLRACGLFQAGRLRGAGADVPNPAEKSIFWSSAGAALEGRLRVVGPLWLGLDAAFLLPFSRERFYITPNQTLHRVPAWGASLGAGMGVLFF